MRVRSGVVGMVIVAALGFGAPPATAQDAMREVRLDIRVEPTGALSVHERQVLDRGDAAPDVLRREFQTRARYDDVHDQRYVIGDVAARVGAEPADVSVERDVDTTTVLVEVGAGPAGPVEVVLEYVVRGAVRPAPDGLEMLWPLLRTSEPLDWVTVTVSAPVVTWAACFAGVAGSLMPCTATQIGDVARPRFDQEGLAADGQMTVVVGMGPESGVASSHILDRRWSIAAAFAVTPLTVGLALGLVGLAALGILVLWRTRGRDRPAAELADLPASPPATGLASPPDGVQPGQLGTVINQSADVVDVVATVLDLAVRGHIRIEEASTQGHTTWWLHRATAPADDLHNYERVVLDRLFDSGRDHVALEEVAEQMREGLPAIQDRLYDDVVAQGWFVERPDAARGRWTTAGLVLSVAGVVLTIALAATTDLGLVGLGMVAAGAVVAWGSDVAPARAARGSELLVRLHDFREQLAAADVTAIPPESADGLLPYAVVFGVEERWMSQAAASDTLPTQLEEFVTMLSGVIAARRIRI